MTNTTSTRSTPLSTTTIIFLSLAPIVLLLYGSFVFNPHNAENIILYLIQVVCDGIAMSVMLALWVTILMDAITNVHHHVLKPLSSKAGTKDVKSVDILLPVAGEPLEVLEKTFRAVQVMEYPHVTYVLDDSSSPAIQKLAKYHDFHYITREGNTHAKAGNLNNGLAQCQGEFFAIFDADQVPHHDFLLKLLPYMEEESIGMVQSPQFFSNTEKFIASGTAQAQEIFYKHVCPSKNISNSAFCVGTNVLFRRSAINQIGGIAKVSHSEDIWTSLLLHEHQWKTVFVNEVLAKGMAPSTISSYFRQQIRWAQGGLSMLFHHNALASKKLNIDQRIQYFSSNFFYLCGFSILYYLLSPIIYLLFGVKSLQTESGAQWLIHYIPYVTFYYSITWLLLGKIRTSTIAVATGTFYPYILAFFSILLGLNSTWKSSSIEKKNNLGLVYWIWPHVLIMCLTILSLIVGWYKPVNFWTTFYYSIWGLINFYILYVFITSERRIVKEGK